LFSWVWEENVRRGAFVEKLEAIYSFRVRLVKLWRVVGWVAANVVLWVAATFAFAVWIHRTVQNEYRLGYRTSSDGDTIAIPIAGFALSLGVVLLAVNATFLLMRLIRRRRARREQAG
jgi:hypothetical protein